MKRHEAEVWMFIGLMMLTVTAVFLMIGAVT